MTYEEESYVLNNIKRLNKLDIETLIKETHENNIMLKAIIKYLAKEAKDASQENIDDFGRNIIANLISSSFDINNMLMR